MFLAELLYGTATALLCGDAFGPRLRFWVRGRLYGHSVAPGTTMPRPPPRREERFTSRLRFVGRQGKTAGQPAHTREAKLGCVFTQTTCDEEGHPIRDPNSTTYTGGIETAEEFGKRIYLEAWNRSWSRAKKKVVIGDGAEWIWNLAEP